MIVVSICVGSSCHLKGAHAVIKCFEEEIEKHGLSDVVELKGTFCLEHCTDGVTIKVEDDLYTGLKPENAAEKFRELVLSRVRSEAK